MTTYLALAVSNKEIPLLSHFHHHVVTAPSGHATKVPRFTREWAYVVVGGVLHLQTRETVEIGG